MAEKQNPLQKALARLRPAGDSSVEALKDEVARLRRGVEELTVLSDLAFAIGAAADPEDIKRKLVKRLMKAVDAEQAVVNLLDREAAESAMNTNIRVVSTRAAQSAFHLGDLVIGWMHLYKKPLVANEPQRDERFRGMKWSDDIRSVACVPLMVKSELIGILTVYNKRDAGGFTPDDERLLTIIAGQSAQVIENARLYTESLLLARMKDEEKHAYNIQRMMLPNTPQIDGYEVVGESVPARTVGGDYYDFIPAQGGRWAIALGDVSGKGLPAALLMSNVHATIRGQTLTGAPVGERVAQANRLLCDSTDDEKFVTLFYGELDPASHRLTYCNAGHEPPFLCTRGADHGRLDHPGGVALGVLPTCTYPEHAIDLESGALVVIYSDGVTDATNAAGQAFGIERFRAVIAENATRPAADIVAAVVAAVKSHAAGEAQFDDVTVVVVKRIS
jgi:sigma-B regulation protein RsbU (phosphoserine phosphatase)